MRNIIYYGKLNTAAPVLIPDIVLCRDMPRVSTNRKQVLDHYIFYANFPYATPFGEWHSSL